MNANTTHLIILGVLAQLPEEDREKVTVLAATIEQLVVEGGKHGLLALALVGSKLEDQ